VARIETGFVLILRLSSPNRDFISVPYSSVSAAEAWVTSDQLARAQTWPSLVHSPLMSLSRLIIFFNYL
jgi:hypothetical protein